MINFNCVVLISVLAMPWVGLQSLIVAYAGNTHLITF